MSKEQTQSISNESYPSSFSEGKSHKYHFWSNKPVLDFDEISAASDSFELLSERSVYSSDDAVPLPSVMEWKQVDMNNSTDMENVQRFLKLYYLVDTKNLFRPDYTPEFIRWALGVDGILLSIVTKKRWSHMWCCWSCI